MGKVRLAARKPLAAWALTGSALVVLAAAVRAALEPAHVSIWLSEWSR